MEKEIFFGDTFIHRNRSKTKVIIDLGDEGRRGFGASTLLDDGSLAVCETDTVDEIVQIIGRMTSVQVTEALEKGMQRMGDAGLTEKQISLLHREAEKGSRIIQY